MQIVVQLTSVRKKEGNEKDKENIINFCGIQI